MVGGGVDASSSGVAAGGGVVGGVAVGGCHWRGHRRRGSRNNTSPPTASLALTGHSEERRDGRGTRNRKDARGHVRIGQDWSDYWSIGRDWSDWSDWSKRKDPGNDEVPRSVSSRSCPCRHLPQFTCPTLPRKRFFKVRIHICSYERTDLGCSERQNAFLHAACSTEHTVQ